MKTSIRPITTPASELEDHSPIGFSGWDRHSACHGSVALATLCPKSESSDDARLGQLAHSVAAYWLMNGHPPKGSDAAMQEFLRPYVEFVWGQLPRTAASKAIWLVEGRVAAPSIHPDCRGTVDALIWDHDSRTLQIHDLKYGGYKVDAEENVQLMGYAVCAIEQFKLKPKRVELYIHQVRISPKPKMWECELTDLELFEDDVRTHVAAIEEQKKILAKTKDPRKLDLHAGDHCRYCPAWSSCHERREAAQREGIDMLVPKPDALPPNVEKAVAFAKQALPWATMVLKNAKKYMMQGGSIPGFKLVAGKRVRVPKDEASFESDLTLDTELGGLGLRARDIMSKPKLLTIPQLEGVMPKDKLEAFNELWEWQPGAPQLATEDDKRPALRARAEDFFKALEDDEDE